MLISDKIASKQFLKMERKQILNQAEKFILATKVGAILASFGSIAIDVAVDTIKDPHIFGNVIESHVGNFAPSTGLAGIVRSAELITRDILPEKAHRLIPFLGFLTVVVANVAAEGLSHMSLTNGNPEFWPDVLSGIAGYSLFWFATSLSQSETRYIRNRLIGS